MSVSVDTVGTMTYALAQPSDHTRVCWAGAIGTASRGEWGLDPAEVIAARALDLLATDPEVCGCKSKNKGQPGRRQRG